MTLVDHSSSGLVAVLVLVLALTLALGPAGLGLDGREPHWQLQLC